MDIITYLLSKGYTNRTIAAIQPYIDELVTVPTKTSLPAIGSSEKIYLTIDTSIIYRWAGTEYVAISAPIPSGGAMGQYLRKDAGNNYELYWGNVYSNDIINPPTNESLILNCGEAETE